MYKIEYFSIVTLQSPCHVQVNPKKHWEEEMKQEMQKHIMRVRFYDNLLKLCLAVQEQLWI